MKNQNRNVSTENQTITFEPIAPQPEAVLIGELLTLTEIDAVIMQHVVLSNAAATALAVCNGDDDFN